jgi:hypothetical protein
VPESPTIITLPVGGIVQRATCTGADEDVGGGLVEGGLVDGGRVGGGRVEGGRVDGGRVGGGTRVVVGRVGTGAVE